MDEPTNDNDRRPATLLELLDLSVRIERFFGRDAAAAVFRLLKPMVPRLEKSNVPLAD